ncbi:MAG: DinB family protein [Planctomycetaceae bacterium]
MKSRDLIRWALNLTNEGTARLVDDMRDAPLTAPTAGGNHPLWTLGHLAFIEGSIPQILFGEPNPVEHWKPLFGTGSEPKSDAGVYPSFDDVLTTYRELRAKNLKRLDELSEADLDRAPRAIPPGFEDAMRTVGQTLLLTSLHNMVHYGQIADARRAAGKKPLM